MHLAVVGVRNQVVDDIHLALLQGAVQLGQQLAEHELRQRAATRCVILVEQCLRPQNVAFAELHERNLAAAINVDRLVDRVDLQVAQIGVQLGEQTLYVGQVARPPSMPIEFVEDLQELEQVVLEELAESDLAAVVGVGVGIHGFSVLFGNAVVQAGQDLEHRRFVRDPRLPRVELIEQALHLQDLRRQELPQADLAAAIVIDRIVPRLRLFLRHGRIQLVEHLQEVGEHQAIRIIGVRVLPEDLLRQPVVSVDAPRGADEGAKLLVTVEAERDVHVVVLEVVPTNDAVGRQVTVAPLREELVRGLVLHHVRHQGRRERGWSEQSSQDLGVEHAARALLAQDFEGLGDRLLTLPRPVADAEAQELYVVDCPIIAGHREQLDEPLKLDLLQPHAHVRQSALEGAREHGPGVLHVHAVEVQPEDSHRMHPPLLQLAEHTEGELLPPMVVVGVVVALGSVDIWRAGPL
mmetsp:Transcript_52488/g.151233  ORF Transcript_52488/g.151233 Transcript_52488/m.151233 type:complete len:465 (-) Transcript_52488:245-1639(-)